MDDGSRGLYAAADPREIDNIQDRCKDDQSRATVEYPKRFAFGIISDGHQEDQQETDHHHHDIHGRCIPESVIHSVSPLQSLQHYTFSIHDGVKNG
jgi:hypothetical protein